MRTEKKSHQQGGDAALTSLGRSSSVVAELWRSFGMPYKPCVPYLDQFPPYVARAMLMAAQVEDACQGEVIVQHDAGADRPKEEEARGVFVVLHGRVDIHSAVASAARDAALVRDRWHAKI